LQQVDFRPGKEAFHLSGGARSAAPRAARQAGPQAQGGAGLPGQAAGIMTGANKARPLLISSREPIHEWFELSYANYLVLPRSLLQSMPVEWQERMVSLLNEMDRAFQLPPVEYRVQMIRDGKFVRDELADYKRGRRRVRRTGNV
jgi:hypothetical protein